MKRHITQYHILRAVVAAAFLVNNTDMGGSCPGPRIRGLTFAPGTTDPKQLVIWPSELGEKLCVKISSRQNRAITLTHEATGTSFRTGSTGFVMISSPKGGKNLLYDGFGTEHTVACPGGCCPADIFTCTEGDSRVNCAEVIRGEVMVCPCERCLKHCPNCIQCPIKGERVCPKTLCPPDGKTLCRKECLGTTCAEVITKCTKAEPFCPTAIDTCPTCMPCVGQVQCIGAECPGEQLTCSTDCFGSTCEDSINRCTADAKFCDTARKPDVCPDYCLTCNKTVACHTDLCPANKPLMCTVDCLLCDSGCQTSTCKAAINHCKTKHKSHLCAMAVGDETTNGLCPHICRTCTNQMMCPHELCGLPGTEEYRGKPICSLDCIGTTCDEIRGSCTTPETFCSEVSEESCPDVCKDCPLVDPSKPNGPRVPVGCLSDCGQDCTMWQGPCAGLVCNCPAGSAPPAGTVSLRSTPGGKRTGTMEINVSTLADNSRMTISWNSEVDRPQLSYKRMVGDYNPWSVIFLGPEPLEIERHGSIIRMKGRARNPRPQDVTFGGTLRIIKKLPTTPGTELVEIAIDCSEQKGEYTEICGNFEFSCYHATPRPGNKMCETVIQSICIEPL